MVTDRCKRVPLVFGLLLGLFFSQPVWAAENEVTITPQQVDGQRVTSSEVELSLDGNEHQLTMSVTNFSSQTKDFVYQGVQAMTDSDGKLTYGTPEHVAGKLPVVFAKLIAQSAFTLSPGETKDVGVSLTLPTCEWGEALGAVQLTSDDEEYTLPLKLVGTKGIPKAKLSLNKIYGGLVSDLPALFITTKNTAAATLAAQPMDLKVVHSYFFGLVKTTWQVHLPQVTWAPNGILNYPISMEGQALKSGSYRVYGTIGQGEDQVKVDKTFTLTKAEVAAINNQAPTVKDATLRWGIPVLIGLTVILILVITVALRQHKKSIRNKR